MDKTRDYMEEARQAGIAIEGLTLTAEQITSYVEAVTHTARKRARALGEDFHEIDFVAGATVVLFATGNNGSVPPAWIFNAIRGVPIFDKGGDE
jgi:hypothetical protein